MSATLYREFTLKSPSIWKLVVSFINDNAAACIARNAPLRIIITEDEMDRLDEQIAFYFGVIVKSTAEQAWVNGRQYSKEVWHEHFAQEFLPPIEIELPTGEIITRRASIARGKIGVKAMAHYTQEVEAYVVGELGVRLPALHGGGR
ncbi:MAG: recombinase [Rhodocyclaceae bacterium]|nr:recombinase [Rhodocyclaceae bacterium]